MDQIATIAESNPGIPNPVVTSAHERPRESEEPAVMLPDQPLKRRMISPLAIVGCVRVSITVLVRIFLTKREGRGPTQECGASPARNGYPFRKLGVRYS
jgi:hypothetical protein